MAHFIPDSLTTSCQSSTGLHVPLIWPSQVYTCRYPFSQVGEAALAFSQPSCTQTVPEGSQHCCYCSATHSYPTLCDPTDCRMPGLSVLHSLLEFAQTHVHWVSNAIQPFHPQSPPSPTLNLSQHQGLSQWVVSSHQVARVLDLQLQDQPFQGLMNIQGWFPLGLIGLISLLSKGLSRVFSSTTVRKHQFFSAQSSLWPSTHMTTEWQVDDNSYTTTEKTIALTMGTFVGKVISLLLNSLSRFAIAFLPRSKHLLISWLQSPSAMILKPRKVKSATVSTLSPSICHEVVFIFQPHLTACGVSFP